MDKTDPIFQNLQRFANDHKLIFEDKSTCGFCRPCVGFVKGDEYIAINPEKLTADYTDTVELLPHDVRLYPDSDIVPDRYHKYDCMAVLVHNDNYDEGLRQLNEWVKYLESIGSVKIVEYDRKPNDIYEIVTHGVMGYAVTLEEKS